MEGIQTNLGLFQTILRFPDFLEGKLDTGLLDRMLEHKRLLEHKKMRNDAGVLLHESPEDVDRRRAAVLAAALNEEAQARNSHPDSGNSGPSHNRWKLEGRRSLLRHPLPDPRR